MTSRADVNHAMEHFAQGKRSESRFRGIVESFIRGHRQTRDHTQPPGPEQRQRPQFGAGGSRQPTRRTADTTKAVFTDGSTSPNPGPGGWCAVWVQNGAIIGEHHGWERQTTNNPHGAAGAHRSVRLPTDAEVDVISDSQATSSTCCYQLPPLPVGHFRGELLQDRILSFFELRQTFRSLLVIRAEGSHHPGQHLDFSQLVAKLHPSSAAPLYYHKVRSGDRA